MVQFCAFFSIFCHELHPASSLRWHLAIWGLWVSWPLIALQNRYVWFSRWNWGQPRSYSGDRLGRSFRAEHWRGGRRWINKQAWGSSDCGSCCGFSCLYLSRCLVVQQEGRYSLREALEIRWPLNSFSFFWEVSNIFFNKPKPQPQDLSMRHNIKLQIPKSIKSKKGRPAIWIGLPWVGGVGALHRPKIKALDRNRDFYPTETDLQRSVVPPDDLRAAQNMSNYSLEVNTSYYSFNGTISECSLDVNTSEYYFDSNAHACEVWMQKDKQDKRSWKWIILTLSYQFEIQDWQTNVLLNNYEKTFFLARVLWNLVQFSVANVDHKDVLSKLWVEIWRLEFGKKNKSLTLAGILKQNLEVI